MVWRKYHRGTFESSVNSYGSKTDAGCKGYLLQFESSVNLYGSKT